MLIEVGFCSWSTVSERDSQMATNGASDQTGDVAMDKPPEPKPKKKGFSLFDLLKESLAKASEGCGPGCGCHVEPEKKKAKSAEAIKESSKQ